MDGALFRYRPPTTELFLAFTFIVIPFWADTLLFACLFVLFGSSCMNVLFLYLERLSFCYVWGLPLELLRRISAAFYFMFAGWLGTLSICLATSGVMLLKGFFFVYGVFRVIYIYYGLGFLGCLACSREGIGSDGDGWGGGRLCI